MKITKGIRELLTKRFGFDDSKSDDEASKLMFEKMAREELSAAEIAEAQKSPTTGEVFGKGKSGSVNVKDASARYSDVRYKGHHVKTGLTVKGFDGSEVETPSERDHALVGVWSKYAANKSGVPVSLNEHERDLLGEVFEKYTFVGEINGEYRMDIKGMQVKELLSDSASGGVNVNPYYYDQAIVTFPLLNGEIMPYVDVRDIPRGSLINGASVGNPTVTWSNDESTNIDMFDTTGLVGPLSTTIHPVSVAVTCGRDMLADSIVELGTFLVENIGQSLLKDLDRVCISGNGTTEPQGILNASITNVIPSIGGVNGFPNIGDVESLLWAVEKQYRAARFRPCFISNDNTYHHFRSIPVGSDDARRVFGMDEQSYTALNLPWRIQQGINDNTAIMACLARYRMYRRQGAEMRWTIEGQTLGLQNAALLIYRGRYGGKVIDANAFAIMDDLGAN